MTWKQNCWQTSLLALMAGAVTIGVPAVPAQTPLPTEFNFNPPNRGAPGRTRDAGSRPACPQATRPFTVLAPKTNWGETIASHPTFWAYLPYQAHGIELVLKDEQTKAVIAQTIFPPNQQAGIARFSLPRLATGLEVDKLYRWQFTFLCNSTSQQTFQADGIIVRRSASAALTRQLKQATPEQRINLFAASGFWFDTLTELAKLRQSRPSDATLKEDWAELLQHPIVGLNDLVSEPLIECCQIGFRPPKRTLPPRQRPGSGPR